MGRRAGIGWNEAALPPQVFKAAGQEGFYRSERVEASMKQFKVIFEFIQLSCDFKGANVSNTFSLEAQQVIGLKKTATLAQLAQISQHL